MVINNNNLVNGNNVKDEKLICICEIFIFFGFFLWDIVKFYNYYVY